MILKNLAYTHNFKDIVQLISDCGEEELKIHLVWSPKNALHTSPEYILKSIDIIKWTYKTSAACIFTRNVFYILHDESQDITSVEQMAMWATFDQMVIFKKIT